MTIIIFTITGTIIGFLVALLFNYFLHKTKIGQIDLKNIAPSIKTQLIKQVIPMINTHLADTTKIVSIINPDAQAQFLKPYIETHVDHFLKHKLAEKIPAMSMLIGPPTIAKIKEGLMEEFDALAPKVITDALHKNATSDHLSLISEKIISKIDDQLIINTTEIIFKKIHDIVLKIGVIMGATIGIVGGIISNIID